MSISTQITRITNDRNTIRSKLVDLGLASANDTLDALASAVSGIANKGTPSATIGSGESYTIAPGYYKGGTVSATGGSGDYTLQAKTNITPSLTQQVISADSGYYGLSSVTINAIPSNYKDTSVVDAVAGDVLANKIIVDASGNTVAGTMVNNGAVVASIDGLVTTSYTIPAGYHNGSGTVSLTNSIELALASV